jgi:hypothetical protein
MKTTVRADAKLQNLPPAAHDELWVLRHPEEEGGKAWTLTDVAAWIPGRFGFPVSVSAVANYYQWLELKVRMDKRAAAVEQFKERLATDKTFSADQLRQVGQKLFMSDGILDNNPKVFLGAVESVQNDTRLAQNEEMIRIRKEAGKREETKLSLATKGKLEAGLDALFAEIKGNAKAEAIFKQLQEVVRKA